MYKVYLETDYGQMRLHLGQFASLDEAQVCFRSRIAEMICQSDAYCDGYWHKWKQEFPAPIQEVLTQLEQGDPPAAYGDHLCGYNDHNTYELQGNTLDINEAEFCKYGADALLKTDALGADGTKDRYSFYLWLASPAAGDGLVLRLCRE